jgi:hypothetical protein
VGRDPLDDRYFTGDILSAPRMFNALGEDGLLPRWLGKVHPAYHTPTWPSLSTSRSAACSP